MSSELLNRAEEVGIDETAFNVSLSALKRAFLVDYSESFGGYRTPAELKQAAWRQVLPSMYPNLASKRKELIGLLVNKYPHGASSDDLASGSTSSTRGDLLHQRARREWPRHQIRGDAEHLRGHERKCPPTRTGALSDRAESAAANTASGAHITAAGIEMPTPPNSAFCPCHGTPRCPLSDRLAERHSKPFECPHMFRRPRTQGAQGAIRPGLSSPCKAL